MIISPQNLVTLITGGASGLGLGTVNRFANKGAQVIFCDLPTSLGAQVAKTIGQNVKFIAADVTKPNDLKSLVDQIENDYGQLNVVVNCAGKANAHIIWNFNKNEGRQLDKFEEVIKVSKLILGCDKLKSILQKFQTNLIGTYNVIRTTSKLMEKNQPDANGSRGVIINTAGVEAYRGHSGQLGTAAASNGIIKMTKPLAKDYLSSGIRVVTISPGIIKTALTDYFPPEVEQTISRECMLAPHRFGDPDEFAHLAYSIVLNPHINATNIELASGLNIV